MNELTYIVNDLVGDLKSILDKAGIYYRIFARQKSDASIKTKLEEKATKYSHEGQKMQDIIGIRIAFYFLEDVSLMNKYLQNLPRYHSVSDSSSDVKKINDKIPDFDSLSDKLFMPTRLNLIFRLDEEHTIELNRELENVTSFDANMIDNTYEIQLRTVLSEGWHEVEHDLRYKTRKEQWWSDCASESRMLNGIYATLETSERAMEQIFSAIAYKNYRKNEWSAMIRNHLKIHTADLSLSDRIVELLNANKKLAKDLFRVDRNKVISHLLNFRTRLPLKMDNLVFLLNRIIEASNATLKELEPKVIAKMLDTELNKD